MQKKQMYASKQEMPDEPVLQYKSTCKFRMKE